MTCKNCARYICVNDDLERIPGDPNWCFYKDDSPCPTLERDCKGFKQKTNEDVFRSLTTEKLAEQIYWLRLDALRLEGFEGQIETKEEILEWLREAAE